MFSSILNLLMACSHISIFQHLLNDIHSEPSSGVALLRGALVTDDRTSGLFQFLHRLVLKIVAVFVKDRLALLTRDSVSAFIADLLAAGLAAGLVLTHRSRFYRFYYCPKCINDFTAVVGIRFLWPFWMIDLTAIVQGMFKRQMMPIFCLKIYFVTQNLRFKLELQI